jgi:plastocyanin
MRKPLLALAATAVAGSAIAAPSLAGGPTIVDVKDDVFAPAKLTIKKGTKVRWVWKGKSRHNVAVAKGPTNFRRGTRKKGTASYTFKKVGTYRILCTIHAPDMKMTVKVTK